MTFIDEELETLEKSPDYRRFLKVYIKYQMYTLCQKLADVGEESFVVTANISDGSFSHVGSSGGDNFLDKFNEIKWKFLSFCSSTDHIPEAYESRAPTDGTSPTGSQSESQVTVVDDDSDASQEPEYIEQQGGYTEQDTEYSQETEDTNGLSHQDTVGPGHIQTETPSGRRRKTAFPRSLAYRYNRYAASGPGGYPSGFTYADYTGGFPSLKQSVSEQEIKDEKSEPKSSSDLRSMRESMLTEADKYVSGFGMDSFQWRQAYPSTGNSFGSKSPIRHAQPYHSPHSDSHGITTLPSAVSTDLQSSVSSPYIQVAPSIKSLYSQYMQGPTPLHHEEMSKECTKYVDTTVIYSSGKSHAEMQLPSDSSMDVSKQTSDMDTLRQSRSQQPVTTTGTLPSIRCFKESYKSHPSVSTSMGPVLSNISGTMGIVNSAVVNTSQTLTRSVPSVPHRSNDEAPPIVQTKNSHSPAEPNTDASSPISHLQPCPVCNRILASKSSLKIHMRTHTGERPFECTVCKKTFIHIHHLVTHQRRHTGDKPFKCKICSKGFFETTSLKRHEMGHLDLRPHQCPLCKKRFNFRSNMKSHWKTCARKMTPDTS